MYPTVLLLQYNFRYNKECSLSILILYLYFENQVKLYLFKFYVYNILQAIAIFIRVVYNYAIYSYYFYLYLTIVFIKMQTVHGIYNFYFETNTNCWTKYVIINSYQAKTMFTITQLSTTIVVFNMFNLFYWKVKSH